MLTPKKKQSTSENGSAKTVPSSEPVDVEVDKDAPVITISGNATAWTKDDVTLTVSAVDSKDGKDGVGVAAYNWGDGWSAVTTLKVSENKTYTVSVKDRVGNVAQESVVVDKIDKTAPKITNVKVDPDEWSNKVSYEVIAEDSESGVKSYKMDDGAWQDSNKFDVTDNKEHKFYAIDNAGNESVAVSATATNFDDIKPVISTVDVKYENTNINVSSDTQIRQRSMTLPSAEVMSVRESTATVIQHLMTDKISRGLIKIHPMYRSTVAQHIISMLKITPVMFRCRLRLHSKRTMTLL